MKTQGATFRGVFLLLGLSLVMLKAGPGPRAAGPLRVYLPADGAAPGWAKDGAPQEYEGEDLYAYIDGGAEIYQEYGFRRVIVQDYKDAKGKSVSLEIFEMTTAASAFGMFTFKRSGNGRTVLLGSGAELEAYYLNFWKGRFLVTLTGFDESPETIEGLMRVGGVVDSNIRETGAAPCLVRALPERGLRPESVKYLKGLLGLNNVYPFYSARGLSFAEAVTGVYGNGRTTLIVLDYGTAAARSSAWGELSAYLEDSERFTRPSGEGAEDLVFLDGKGRYVALSTSGPRLLVGVSPDADTALEIVRLAR
jgi:hypothetical protein